MRMDFSSFLPEFGTNIKGLLAPWAGLVGLIIGAMAVFSGEGLRERYRESLGRMLSESNATAWARATNQWFLGGFDKLFGARGTLIEQSIWKGLLLSPAMLALARVLSLANGTGRTTEELLLFAITMAFSIAFGIALGHVLANRSSSAIVFGIVIVIGIGSGSVNSIVNGGIGIAVVSIISIGIGIGSGSGIVSGNGIVSGGAIGIGIVSVIGIIGGTVSGIGSAIAVGSAIIIFLATRDFQLPVHPLKALLSSLVVIGVMSLIKTDAARSFLVAIDSEGYKVLGFIAFNMFADGVSLVETRWVLQRGAEATILRLLGLLVLDLTLSTAIFLVLPTILWEVPALVDAILFRGDRPWVGILFWTTFSTSTYFYLFVCAALLARVSAHILRVLRIPIDVEELPMNGVAAAAIVEVTTGFVLWAGVAALW